MSKLKDPVLLVDKLIDLVFMFIGLYLAIAVQDWQDLEKSKEQYKQLISGFLEEVKANQDQKQAVEDQIATVNDFKNIGQAQIYFDYFHGQSKYFEDFLKTYEAMFILKQKKRTATEEEELKAFIAKLREKSTFKKPETFELTPMYRKDVWNFYLAGGVHLFQTFNRKDQSVKCLSSDQKTQNLAICIGSTYGFLHEIEKIVDEIQVLVNDTYFGKQAEIDAIFKGFSEQIKEIDSYGKDHQNQMMTTFIQNHIDKIQAIRALVNQNESLVKFKIKLLKTKLLQTDERLNSVANALSQELHRL
jgi:hypothetical protein